MKPAYILSFSLLLTFSAAVQAQEKKDTICAKENVEEVVISESQNNITVSVKGSNSDGAYTSEYVTVIPDSVTMLSTQHEQRGFTNFKLCGSTTKSRRWSNEIIGGGSLLLGFMTTTDTPEGIRLNHGRVSEISWLNMVYYQARLKNSRHAFSIGFGLSWRSFSLINTQTFGIDAGRVSFADYDGTATLKRSRLKVFSLSVPVLWTWKFCKNRNLKLGPILNFNTHASLKTTTEGGSTEWDVSTNDIAKRPVTMDMYGSVEIASDCGIYLRYSPMSIFKTNVAPDLRPLSFGVVFGF